VSIFISSTYYNYYYYYLELSLFGGFRWTETHTFHLWSFNQLITVVDWNLIESSRVTATDHSIW
jgi:hypothetical protein